jgi:hypothetical protein
LLKLAGIQLSCCEEKERNIEKAVKFAQIAVEKGSEDHLLPGVVYNPWFPREMNNEHFSLAERWMVLPSPPCKNYLEIMRSLSSAPFLKRGGGFFQFRGRHRCGRKA